MRYRKDTHIELFCAREITAASLQSDSTLVDGTDPGLLVAGNYLFEAPGSEIVVLTRAAFERDYTVVITRTSPPTEHDLIRAEEAFGFFRLAFHEQALYCQRRERRILTLNGHAVYAGGKMLLHVGRRRWVEVTLVYEEQAGCYYAVDEKGQRIEFSPDLQQAAMHPRGHTCWAVWALPESV
jgi:hypothetical protein